MSADQPGRTASRATTLLPGSIRVLELGESLSTAMCGLMLSKLGAQVTRILPSGTSSALDALGPFIGTGAQRRSAVAEWLHQGKTLLEVDLAERETLEAHVRGADVVLVAGMTAEWAAAGLPVEDVRAMAPTAVIGQITQWGDGGPHAHLHGGELQLQAMGGFMNLIGVMDREPVRLGGYPMQGIAALLALDGVMIGLFRRQSTGEGAHFHTSEFEAVAHAEWKIATSVQAGRQKELRGQDGGGPVVVRCRDGHFALFFVPKNWDDVKTIIDDRRLDEERFSTPTDRARNRAELKTIIEETTRSLSKEDLYYRAQALNVPAGHVATVSDLLSSPQYTARDFFQAVEVPGVGHGYLPEAPWQVLLIDDVDAQGSAG
jgi:CoA:oxalate CoA-transferase